jgi:hypothetical protein
MGGGVRSRKREGKVKRDRRTLVKPSFAQFHAARIVA